MHSVPGAAVASVDRISSVDGLSSSPSFASKGTSTVAVVSSCGMGLGGRGIGGGGRGGHGGWASGASRGRVQLQGCWPASSPSASGHLISLSCELGQNSAWPLLPSFQLQRAGSQLHHPMQLGKLVSLGHGASQHRSPQPAGTHHGPAFPMAFPGRYRSCLFSFPSFFDQFSRWPGTHWHGWSADSLLGKDGCTSPLVVKLSAGLSC
jgi:hypothetical protein